jgi:hypothetical protein
MALSAEDLQRAAMACRVAADQARQDVERQENPQTQAIFEKMAAEYIKRQNGSSGRGRRS